MFYIKRGGKLGVPMRLPFSQECRPALRGTILNGGDRMEIGFFASPF
jgi:hypothetical protein